ASEPQNQRPRRLDEGWSARPPAGSARPFPPDKLAVPAEHGLGRHEEGAPRLPRQVAARRGEEKPVAPAKSRPANVPTEHLQLVAKDHDLQILGVLLTSHEPDEDSPEDQGHERPHHGDPPAPEMLSDPSGVSCSERRP